MLQKAAEAADTKNRDQKRGPFNTRLTVTSMAGYFQDRIVTQGMLRAMAILYIGPKRNPDLDHDYYLSPVVAPAHLLAEFHRCCSSAVRRIRFAMTLSSWQVGFGRQSSPRRPISKAPCHGIGSIR